MERRPWVYPSNNSSFVERRYNRRKVGGVVLCMTKWSCDVYLCQQPISLWEMNDDV